MRLSLVSLAVHLLYVHGLDVIRNNGNLEITNAQVSPDGFTRSAVVVGTSAGSGTTPGPLIMGNKGDSFNLNVIDSLADTDMNRTTSIHWHGIFQEHTNWADGPSFVTQCPIAPGNSFLYSFKVPDQAGTFWYHSHLGVQYCDGLRGPLVIYDPQDPQAHLYDIDDETTIITLADWYHLLAMQVLADGAPLNNATLINGQGRYPGGPDVALAVVSVQSGKRYRFRLISMACDPNYMFSIDGHNLTVIEADGVNTVPVIVEQIQIFAAQRYSFVLNAVEPVGNYWIRALPSTPLQGTTNDSFANGINSAILRYYGAPNADPTTSESTPTAVIDIDEQNLHPLTNPAAPGQPFPGGADKVINMTLGFNATTGQFSINGVPFISPTVPVLLQILSGTLQAQDLLPKGSIYGLPKNSVIEININGGNAVGGPHPFHLHGHTFSVIKPADSDVYNFVNPVQRDVVPVAAGNTTSFRFVTNNPGPWFLHCHIDFHLAAGLAVVMAEDIADVPFNDPVPAEWDALCPIYDHLSPSQL
ncbi:laccase [Gymnopus androsaceus JB14]|uniref:Laccase n=1 Tax=Gymnopus androsaceus JB14 TaxID=1447944 RepID=A0A6A4H263_9AGAR|nr:laccase [Gymnopus androsaceus JB14]